MKTRVKIVFVVILFILFIGISLSTSFFLDESKSKTVNAGSNTGESTGIKPGAPVNPGANPGESEGEMPGLPMSDSFSFVKSLMALTFVLGLIFLAAYLFKRITGIKTAGLRSQRVPIQMVGNLPLGDKKFLSIVEIQGKHYFIGISQNSINLLSELELDLSGEEGHDNEGRDFIDIFKKARMMLKNQYRSPMGMKK